MLTEGLYDRSPSRNASGWGLSGYVHGTASGYIHGTATGSAFMSHARNMSSWTMPTLSSTASSSAVVVTSAVAAAVTFAPAGSAASIVDAATTSASPTAPSIRILSSASSNVSVNSGAVVVMAVIMV